MFVKQSPALNGAGSITNSEAGSIPMKSVTSTPHAASTRNVTKETLNSLTIGSGRNGTTLKKAKPKQYYAVVTFINGIYHSVEDWQRITAQLESTFKCPVRPFYNPSSGWWMKDISKAGFDLVLRPNDLILAKDLADHFRAAFEDLKPNGRILHLAHSGGAILSYLAAKHHLSRAEAARIDVCTFGGGKSITQKYFKGHVRNYYSRNDPLTIVDKRANKLLKRSGTASWAEVQESKHNTTFVYLEPLENHPITDHSMEGRTYKVALELEAEALARRVQVLQQELAREEEFVRLVRKRMANVTGMHHFWDRVLPERLTSSGRKIRKGFAQQTRLRGFFSGKYRTYDAGIMTNGTSDVLDEEQIMRRGQLMPMATAGNTEQPSDPLVIFDKNCAASDFILFVDSR